MAVRGGGEMASAAARLLHLCGHPVIVLERPRPLAVRRLVSFAQAVLAGEASVDGVRGVRTEVGGLGAARLGHVPVAVDPEGACLAHLAPALVVDARMAKRNLGNARAPGRFLVGLGPGFSAGEDVDAVVETHRGPDLGRVIWQGPAAPDTAVPAPLMGETVSRVLRAPCSGVFRGTLEIGALVEPGTVVGTVGGAAVVSAIGGLLRGRLAEGVPVEAGVKVGDVDPRGSAIDPARLSDKARAIAAGVLEAVAVCLGRA